MQASLYEVRRHTSVLHRRYQLHGIRAGRFDTDKMAAGTVISIQCFVRLVVFYSRNTTISMPRQYWVPRDPACLHRPQSSILQASTAYHDRVKLSLPPSSTRHGPSQFGTNMPGSTSPTPATPRYKRLPSAYHVHCLHLQHARRCTTNMVSCSTSPWL